MENWVDKIAAEEYEQSHVHSVYQEIASHFSLTRYKPWPIVERFLKGLPPGSVGLDVGCGNGKYLSVNPSVFILASDRSENLVRIAATHKQSTALVADGISLPHRDSEFDFAISIAVIHHLSTSERRIEAVRAVLDTLKPKGGVSSFGKALFFVWALEQKSSRRGWSEGDEQDVMVPWILKQNGNADSKEERTFHRYYHLYRKGELERDIVSAGGQVVESGYDRDNWWAIASR